MFELPTPKYFAVTIPSFSDILYYISLYRWFILVPVVLFALFALFIILVARFEIRWINMFEPCDEPDPASQSPYTKAMNTMAAQLGFFKCGWFRQYRKKLCRATATMWLSPDALTLLIVGGGKMVGIYYRTTFLYSKPNGGPVLVTSDEPGEKDLTGVIVKEFLFNADLKELYDLHISRLQPWKDNLNSFDESLIRKSIDVGVEHGLFKYLDNERRKCRYTLKGALLCYFRGFRVSFKTAKEQKDRLIKTKRPGDT